MNKLTDLPRDAGSSGQDSMEACAKATREYVEALAAAVRAEYDRLSPPATRAFRPREGSLLAYADACAAFNPDFDPRLLAEIGAPERAADFADMADARDRRAAREQAAGAR